MVITPVLGCTENSPGDLGICSKMLYFRRVCIVSGSSLSVAQTTPTVVPTCLGFFFLKKESLLSRTAKYVYAYLHFSKFNINSGNLI